MKRPANTFLLAQSFVSSDEAFSAFRTAFGVSMSPNFTVTFMPALGVSENITGTTTPNAYQSYGIAVLSYYSGDWWYHIKKNVEGVWKDLWNINTDNTFSIDYYEAGSSENANKIGMFLLPLSFTSNWEGSITIPQVYYDDAIAYQIFDRQNNRKTDKY